MRVSQDVKDERSHRTVWTSEAATNEPHTRKMQARLYINVDRGQTIGSKEGRGS
jgi:hypothetical protein